MDTNPTVAADQECGVSESVRVSDAGKHCSELCAKTFWAWQKVMSKGRQIQSVNDEKEYWCTLI